MKARTKVIVFFALLLPASTVLAQKTEKEKLDLAMERAKLASETLRAVAELPNGKGLPKEVADKAVLIGIVPDASRLSLLFSRATRGHGMFSVREAGKPWSLPVFCLYYSAPGFKFSGVGPKSVDAVFVVTAENPAATANAPSAKSKQPRTKYKVFSYAFGNGELKLISGTSPSDNSLGLSSFFKDSPGWKNEDSFNKAVYGTKGDEVLDGKVADSKISGTAVADFRDALNELFPTR
jgi:hypothetical protein